VKPAISVIIVNLNRRELLGRCLESLWRQTLSDFEVIDPQGILVGIEVVSRDVAFSPQNSTLCPLTESRFC
jgi:GT2 family glycosyltransferase